MSDENELEQILKVIEADNIKRLQTIPNFSLMMSKQISSMIPYNGRQYNRQNVFQYALFKKASRIIFFVLNECSFLFDSFYWPFPLLHCFIILTNSEILQIYIDFCKIIPINNGESTLYEYDSNGSIIYTVQNDEGFNVPLNFLNDSMDVDEDSVGLEEQLDKPNSQVGNNRNVNKEKVVVKRIIDLKNFNVEYVKEKLRDGSFNYEQFINILHSYLDGDLDDDLEFHKVDSYSTGEDNNDDGIDDIIELYVDTKETDLKSSSFIVNKKESLFSGVKTDNGIIYTEGNIVGIKPSLVDSEENVDNVKVFGVLSKKVVPIEFDLDKDVSNYQDDEPKWENE